MKLIILLAVIACSRSAKLDRNYLPPSYAQTSGGSGNFLQTPVGPSQDYQNNGFQTAGSGNYASNEAFDQSGSSFDQNGNNFAQNGNSFDQNGNGFAQNGNDFAQNGNGFAQNDFSNFEGRPERAQAAFERNAAILRQDNQNDGETYSYAYETENGITAEENGVATNGVEAQGGFSYTGDDGQVYSIRYTADQNGFVPEGDHLPTPPPIPEEILKALEQNARDEANGIFDDGTYNEAKYGGDENGQFNDNSGYNYNNGNGNNFNAGGDINGIFNNNNNDGDAEDSIVTNNALIRSNNQAFGNQYTQADFGSQNTQEAFGNLNTQASYGNQNAQTGFGSRNTQASFGNQNAQPGFGNQNTQASFGGQNAQAGFGNQNTQASFGNQNAGAGFGQNVEKAYLPPERNGQRGQTRYQQNRRTDTGLEKSYLPPEQFGQRQSGGRQNERYNQRNGIRNGANGVERSYLPPLGQQVNGLQGSSYHQPQSYQGVRGPASRGQAGRNGASREYLPPSQNQRTNGRGSGRRPSFNSRNGYQY